MWVDALVIIATPDHKPEERRTLDAAMLRRGWDRSGPEGYTASFTNPQSDQSLVKLVEQDVRQAVYVAGINHFDAVCLLADTLDSEEYESEEIDDGWENPDHDLNHGLL